MANGLLAKVALVCLLATVALGIVSVVLNVIILTKENARQPEPTAALTRNCEATTKPTISKSPGFKAAADLLLEGLDFDYDPCKNFYKFTCNKYTTSAKRHMGAFGEVEMEVLKAISETLTISNTSQPSSITELILQKAFNSCVNWHGKEKAASLHQIMTYLFSGIPMLESNWNETTVSDADFWSAIGTLELRYAVPSLLQSYVTIDTKNVSRNALYIDQIPLYMPRDFYVKPQFLDYLNEYLDKIVDAAVQFGLEIKSTATREAIFKDAVKVARLELKLALASVPSALLRNYEEKSNSYNIEQLKAAYPSIGWEAYLGALLQRSVQPNDSFNINQPSYLGTLNTILAGEQFSKRTFVNFVAIHFVEENLAILQKHGGDHYAKLFEFLQRVKSDRKRHRSSASVSGAALHCVNLVINFMPMATGYTYIKGIDANLRDNTREDVSNMTSRVIEQFLGMISTLPWLTEASLGAAKRKANGLIKNIGWPDWFDFTNTLKIDEYHKNYVQILELDDSWDILNALKYSSQLTENFGSLTKKPDRRSFQGSPAVVNAWYIPERNSITIPFAILNPPFYRHDFPEAYKYGGEGAIVGHELTHGYDDEGVQFGPDGALSSCSWNYCGWMDDHSKVGFIKMAQCVVSQYSEKCCPLKTGNVHCASGERTQGENIADIGGRLAAYKAYRDYVAVDREGIEEDRLPGLEEFTPNQIFWIMLGRVWCKKTYDEGERISLMTDPHPPRVCRVNQVVQDIPEFGKDFNCPYGAPMYPRDTQRCQVWTGQRTSHKLS